MALLDDDILLEPESLLRMIRVFAYAQPNVCIGGHMLDSIQRHRLYEAGAVVTNEHWTLRPSHADRDLRQNEVLNALLDVPATDYNGWWMFGLPASAVAEAGMPLPCFIRGDDVEFGLRLGGLGRLTVPFPGVAVWHEPFYLKIGGWHLYYETRNLLIAAALHLEFSRGKLALILLKRVMQHLLTYRYYNAALVLRAIGDFMMGPAILRRDPLQIHAGLLSLRQDYPASACRREVPLVAARPAREPRSALGQGWRMLRVLVFNMLPPVRVRAKPRLLPVHDLIWFRMLGLNHVAVDTYWDLELPVLRRSAASFLKLATTATRSIARLSFSISRCRAAWRDAMPELTSVGHWRQYLNLADAALPTAEVSRPAVTVCPPAA